MADMNKLKSDLCLFISCGLSVSVISGVVLWVDNQGMPVRSDVAMTEANQTVENYCAKAGGNDCNNLKLVEATAPKTGTNGGTEAPGWKFDYYSPSSGRVTIQVRDDGDAKVVSKTDSE